MHLLGRQPPSEIRDWLLDTSSLTARLLEASEGDFAVKVIGEKWGRPMLSEYQVLGLPITEQAKIRQVYLYGKGQPWVFARTVIPASTLTGPERRLNHLGTRPLGAYLFAQQGMLRGEVEITRIPAGRALFDIATAPLKKKPKAIWGRRSVFYLHGKALLVSEIFVDRLFCDD